jgi:asparaginyl-tRNA synthetase
MASSIEALKDKVEEILPSRSGPATSTTTIYVDTDVGKDDKSADGSESKPYQSLAYAYIINGTDGKSFLSRQSVTGVVSEGGDPSEKLAWKEPAKSAVKKAQNALDQHKKKLAKQAQIAAAEEEKEQQRIKNLEEAKKIILEEDVSLPKATKITIGHKDVQLGEGEVKGTRVKVAGRIHRLRQQKQATFITLIDGYGHLQCVLTGDLTKTYDALTFAQGTSLTLYGEMRKVLTGQSAPDNRELIVDYFKVIGTAPSDKDAITNKVSAEQNQWDSAMLDSRHLVLRGDTASSVMKVRSAVEWAFAKCYRDMKFTKISPPALVQTQVEGGSTLFELDYYEEKAYLTQSSQLYLETGIQSLGNVYCIEKSFRAEKSLTRRHLSEYSHVEAELDFIDFTDLLEHLEEIMCSVIDTVLADPEIAGYIKALNPGFKAPSRPFKRMKYADAIDWLNAQDPPILNEEGNPHTFGDDIAEAAERRMTDIINLPIFLTHFPVEIKAFYMKKDPSDLRVTESVDCLMPGVGEIVGGSMRMEGYEELMAAYEREGISPKEYYWYTDQRKYGTSPHGGYGLGLERFIAWVCNQHSVRTCCLYPRFMGRCKP